MLEGSEWGRDRDEQYRKMVVRCSGISQEIEMKVTQDGVVAMLKVAWSSSRSI